MAISDRAKRLARAATGWLNLGVAGSSAVVATALHSVPVAAIGLAAYGALVAWDYVGGAGGSRAREVELPAESSLSTEQLRQTVKQIATAREERHRVLEGTPIDIRGHLIVALVSLTELETRAVRLIERADALARYLSGVDVGKVNEEAAKMAALAARATDKAAHEEYELADLADAGDRVTANLTRIIATLEAFPSRVMRLRALDAQATEQSYGDIEGELGRVNSEIQIFEDTLKTLAQEVQPS